MLRFEWQIDRVEPGDRERGVLGTSIVGCQED